MSWLGSRPVNADVALALVELGHDPGLDVTDPRVAPANPFEITDGTNTQPCALDPDAWFPERGQPADEAKRWCAGCEFKVPCLLWAMHHYERGIWGGSAERDRRWLRRLARLPETEFADLPDDNQPDEPDVEALPSAA